MRQYLGGLIYLLKKKTMQCYVALKTKQTFLVNFTLLDRSKTN